MCSLLRCYLILFVSPPQQYLYDPITGDGPIPTAATGSGAGQFSSSSLDTCGERSKIGDPNTAMRKKKTPTQLRRERKKRQKERERRQREMEKQQQTEGKTVKGTETAETKKDERKQSNQDEQTNDTNAGEKYSQQDAVLGEPSSSDSEHSPESSCNSPTHSSSSLTKSVDNDEPQAEDPEIPAQRENLSCFEESNEAAAAIKEPKPVSTVTESATEERIQEVKPNTGMVMLARAEVKILQHAGMQAMLTTTQETITTKHHGSTREGSSMQDGEIELELKPEE